MGVCVEGGELPWDSVSGRVCVEGVGYRGT